MVAPGPSNVIARRVVDDLIDFSGEAAVPKFMNFFLSNGLQISVGLLTVDDIRDENNKLMDLNAVIAQAEECIAIKEEHIRVMKAAGDDV
nr:hypothetical protein [Tanacetum cinerariifolium]